MYFLAHIIPPLAQSTQLAADQPLAGARPLDRVLISQGEITKF
jgi:hypothetical protein